ncbi:MAG: GDP-L-fucose synthase family protein [Candidatus Odinarchaeia archaeon]
MEKISKIYVAGHRGLVGSAIVRKLREKGYNNLVFRTSKELDLRRQKDTEEFFEKEKPDYVFVAAAKVGGILANRFYVADFIYDNVSIITNIVNSSYRFGVKKLLNLGSSCIYPRECPQPMKEEYFLSGKPEPTNEAYAIAKILAIKLCRYYNEQYKTNFISVMPSNLYGPNDNFNLETAHMLAMFIRKFHLAKLLSENNFEAIKKDIKKYSIGFSYDEKINKDDEKEVKEVLGEIGITADSVTIWGTGDPYREFLYVDDLADACVFLMENYDYEEIGEFANIGTGKDLKVREYAEIVKKIVGFKGKIKNDLSKPDGMPRKLLDVGKLKKLGWVSHTDIVSGIEKTYEWYKISVEGV